jgi:hypothetical protein
MDNYQELIQENKDLRKQLVELAGYVRDIQDEARLDDISYELRVLLRSVPSKLLHPALY